MDIYKAFMQSSLAIGILKDNDHCIKFTSDFYLQILGKEKDILGKPLLASFPEGLCSFY